MPDPRTVEESIVVRMRNVDVDPNAPRTPLRFDEYMFYIEPVIKRYLNEISIEIHELFPDAEILRRGETWERPHADQEYGR